MLKSYITVWFLGRKMVSPAWFSYRRNCRFLFEGNNRVLEENNVTLAAYEHRKRAMATRKLVQVRKVEPYMAFFVLFPRAGGIDIKCQSPERPWIIV
jgi:hypothetical protein